MSSQVEQQYLSTCPSCDESIDVTALEPFTKLKCPFCGQDVRVRRKFDHFRIVRQIGEGGMSRVFEAEDETLGRRVALKILNRQYGRDAVRVEQFRKEALITARIAHPNVIKLYSVGHDQGYFYIAMELVGGGSLEQRIRREGHVQEGEVLRIGREVAEGLRAAQRLGLIHRDVKPANILFTESGTAKVVDFGLALFTERDVDDSGEIWATPYYVAPEKVIENREDYRSDIYSLGASLFHALTGRPPHKADTNSIQELRMIKCRRVSLEDSGLHFSERTSHVVNAMLAFKPEDRFHGYDEVVEELRLAEGLVGKSVFRATPRRIKWMVAAGAAIVVAFVVGWVLRSNGDKRAASITRHDVTGDSGSASDGSAVEAGHRTVSERFLGARELLLKGSFGEAGKQFERIVNSGDARQPTLNWARYNAALCAIIEGKKGLAMRNFEDMANDSTVPNSPAGNDLSAFFRLLGRRMADNLGLGLGIDEALGYGTSNEELMGYLIHGLAEWEFGSPEKAMRRLSEFSEMALQMKVMAGGGAQEWVPRYRDLAAPYEADWEKLKLLLAHAGDAPQMDLAAAGAALEASRKVRAELSRKSAAIDSLLDQRESELKRVIAQVRMAEQKRRLADEKVRRQRELEQLTELSATLPTLVQGYDFSRVLDVLKNMSFESPEVQSALDGRRYLYATAQDFMNQIIADVRVRGYTGRIVRREGSPITGRVTALDSAQISVSLDRGVIVLPMSQVAPESLVDMAHSFAATIRDSTDYYHRQELIAAFARVTGLQGLSATVAAQLMEEHREFRNRWLKVLQGGI